MGNTKCVREGGQGQAKAARQLGLLVMEVVRVSSTGPASRNHGLRSGHLTAELGRRHGQKPV